MDAETLAALDRNFRLASAETFASSDDGAAYETRDVHCVSCGYPIAEFNWAFPKLSGADVERAVVESERFFGDRATPFRFILREPLASACQDILVERGHARLDKTTPGMSITTLRPPTKATLRIARVESPATLADFQRTAFEGFGMPTAMGSRFLTARLLESPETRLLVGYVGDVPVATSMMIATGRVAGIYWVATPEPHRRKGHAEALTWAALDAGRALGCTIGSLQASEMGRPVYVRMGFAQTAEYVFFERTPERA